MNWVLLFIFLPTIIFLLIKNASAIDGDGQTAKIGRVTKCKKLHPKTRVVRQHFTGFVFLALLIFNGSIILNSVILFIKRSAMYLIKRW